jgi:hypothetical protein
MINNSLQALLLYENLPPQVQLLTRDKELQQADVRGAQLQDVGNLHGGIEGC